jgi:hypothetical protein
MTFCLDYLSEIDGDDDSATEDESMVKNTKIFNDEVEETVGWHAENPLPNDFFGSFWGRRYLSK